MSTIKITSATNSDFLAHFPDGQWHGLSSIFPPTVLLSTDKRNRREVARKANLRAGWVQRIWATGQNVPGPHPGGSLTDTALPFSSCFHLSLFTPLPLSCGANWVLRGHWGHKPTQLLEGEMSPPTPQGRPPPEGRAQASVLPPFPKPLMHGSVYASSFISSDLLSIIQTFFRFCLLQVDLLCLQRFGHRLTAPWVCFLISYAISPALSWCAKYFPSNTAPLKLGCCYMLTTEAGKMTAGFKKHPIKIRTGLEWPCWKGTIILSCPKLSSLSSSVTFSSQVLCPC